MKILLPKRGISEGKTQESEHCSTFEEASSSKSFALKNNNYSKWK
jgi:hypothetical protein